MLENEIKKLTQAVTENTEKMSELIEAIASGATGTAESAPKSKPKAKKAEPAPEPEVEEAAEEEPETEEAEAETEEQGEAEHSTTDLKTKFGELSKAKTGAAVKKLLKKHGYTKFSDVTEGDPAIDDMYAEAEKQLGE